MEIDAEEMQWNTPVVVLVSIVTLTFVFMTAMLSLTSVDAGYGSFQALFGVS